MGTQKPGFLAKYFVAVGRFGKNPVSLVGVRKSCLSKPISKN